MADVESDRDGVSRYSRLTDRGQLILIAGLTIAVILVALVLLLNTVIYTENLATRGIDAGGMDAIEYRMVVVGGVGELLDEENKQSGDFAQKESRILDGINATDDALARNTIRRGVLAEINRSSIELYEGIHVVQNESSEFVSNEGNSSWNVSENVYNVRQFWLNIGHVSTFNESEMENGFHVRVANETDSWELYVYNDSATGNITVASTEGGGTEIRCSFDIGSAALHVTGATVNGMPCDELRWANAVVSPYSVEFVNGDEIEGQYSLTVDGEPGSLNESGQSPYYHEAVYSATAEIMYQTSEIRFVTEVRIAPGEADD